MKLMFRILTANTLLLYLGMKESTAIPVDKPLVQKIRHIGLPTRGKYTVREDVEKAPTYDHPCNLTRTAVKISFPEEMRSEIFVNLLGYKEPNLLHLQRCKGRCTKSDSPLTCRATKVREKKVKMTIRSYLTGKKPVDKVKELVLDEHVECGCECSHELAAECAGRLDDVTCECECPSWQFGERKAYCDLRRDAFWDSTNCQCESKTVAARGAVDHGDHLCGKMAEKHLDIINTSSDDRVIDMVAWIVLGSSLTLVIALSVTTYHYRNRVHQARRKLNTAQEQRLSFKGGNSDSSHSIKYNQKQSTAEEYKILRKIPHSATPAYAPDLDFLDGGILLDRDEEQEMGPHSEHEQYNQHGVRIENNCFE